MVFKLLFWVFFLEFLKQTLAADIMKSRSAAIVNEFSSEYLIPFR